MVAVFAALFTYFSLQIYVEKHIRRPSPMFLGMLIGVEGSLDGVEIGSKFFLGSKSVFDILAGVYDCGVCSVDFMTDCSQRHFTDFFSQIHNNLPGIGHLALAAFCEEQIGADVVVSGYGLGYHLEVDLTAFYLYGICHYPPGKIERYVAVKHGGVCHERNYDTFKFAYTLCDVGGYVVGYVGGNSQTVLLGFQFEHVATQGYVGTLEFDLHTPFESAQQSRFESFHLRRCAVARHDYLTVVLMQVVEDVEESILSTGQILQILNIVYYKTVDTLIEVEEAVDVLGCCCRVLALEESCSHVEYACMRIVFLDTDAYCLYKVCFADARRTENEQGIESFQRGVIADSHAYGACNLIAVAGTIVVECVSRIELRVEIV